jgi:SpoVK/Ycf46/Vps4 family AAA+-type ATPase
MVGIPGAGKSHTVKSIAASWGLPLLKVDIGALFGKFQGQSEENTRNMIQLAEAVAPCVLFLDEIEKGLSGVSGSGDADGGSSGRMFASLLTWMQEKTKPVFVVATANNVDKLPPELLRSGRLDAVFFMDLPTEEERHEIWKIQLAKYKRNPDTFDDPTAFETSGLKRLVRESKDFTGAEIEACVVEALYTAFAAGVELKLPHLIAAIAEVIPISKTAPEQLGRVREWATKGRARLASVSERELKQAAVGDRFSDLET